MCGLCRHFDMESFGKYKKEYAFCRWKREYVRWDAEPCENFSEWW